MYLDGGRKSFTPSSAKYDAIQHISVENRRILHSSRSNTNSPAEIWSYEAYSIYVFDLAVTSTAVVIQRLYSDCKNKIASECYWGGSSVYTFNNLNGLDRLELRDQP